MAKNRETNMTGKKTYFLAVLTAGCMTLLSYNSYAQEDGYPSYNFQEPSYQELNLLEDKALIYEQNENRPSRTIQSIQRDSIAMHASKNKSNKKAAAEKKEDDALSFNFLYYIIQKYKISDIVDQ
ncbi:MAG TPA: hypothetical protein PKJ63_00050 [Cyclobacteriaceae bacterium]|nr:hypothetical protein [Cyclobacteriaceae bacterium]